MMNKDYNFVNFHAHSIMSTQDSLISIKDIVSEAKRLGHCSCTISEHGHLASMPTFVKECEKEGINFRIGVEFYFQWDENKKERSSYHLLVVAKNETGWLNLLKLQKLSNTSVDEGGGFFGRPRVLKSMLEEHKEGLHISSACLSGPICSELLKGKETDARIVAEYFRDTYESFTIEIMPHALSLVAEANRKILVIAKELNIPFITSLDVHIKNDSYIDSYLANGDLRRSRTISDRDNPDIDCLRDPDFWYKTPEEIIKVYSSQGICEKDVIESFKNTLSLDSMMNFKWERRLFDAPKFCENPNEELEKIIAKKMFKKYGSSANIPQEVKTRVRYEYNVIKNLDFCNYFLILNDAMEFADTNGIVRGIGRGSAGASLVLYILGIVKINPLDYNLAFSRFLNEKIKKFPDVDLDLQPEGRVAIIEYLKTKYGDSNIVQVSNYSEMKPKAAIKDAGKWLEIDFKTVNTITSLIPDKEYNDDGDLQSLTFNEVKLIPEISKYIREFPRLFSVAEKLSGSMRQFNIHAGAVCVLPQPAEEIIPVFRKKDDSGADVMVSQWNKNILESVSINKYDLLGLSSLTVLKTLEELTGVKIDDISYDDKKTWDFFKSSKFNLGIFQFAEPKSKKFLRDIQPEKITDLSDCTTLIRPGADAKTYFDNKKSGKIKYKFDVQEVKDELKNSYGAIIYQENLINLGASLSDLDLGESDLMRRALEKGKQDDINKYKDKFVQTCKYPDIAEDMFEWLKESAQYLFCKPHGICYSIISYICAYYKANFPEQFIVANIRNPKDGIKQTKSEYINEFIQEARKMGIKVSLPMAGKCQSVAYFDQSGKVVYLGLSSLKGITDKPSEVIKLACESALTDDGNIDLKAFCDFCFEYKITTDRQSKKGEFIKRAVVTKAHLRTLLNIGFLGGALAENITTYNKLYKEELEIRDVESACNETLGFDFYSPFEKYKKMLDERYHDTSKYLIAKVVDKKSGTGKTGYKWELTSFETERGRLSAFGNNSMQKGTYYLIKYEKGDKDDTIKVSNSKLL